MRRSISLLADLRVGVEDDAAGSTYCGALSCAAGHWSWCRAMTRNPGAAALLQGAQAAQAPGKQQSHWRQGPQ